MIIKRTLLCEWVNNPTFLLNPDESSVWRNKREWNILLVLFSHYIFTTTAPSNIPGSWCRTCADQGFVWCVGAWEFLRAQARDSVYTELPWLLQPGSIINSLPPSVSVSLHLSLLSLSLPPHTHTSFLNQNLTHTIFFCSVITHFIFQECNSKEMKKRVVSILFRITPKVISHFETPCHPQTSHFWLQWRLHKSSTHHSHGNSYMWCLPLG